MSTDLEARHDDRQSLAAALAPLLSEACEGRLSDITWFRTDWQRGGAATGTATLRLDDGRTADVVVKMPVVQRELVWMRRLAGGGAEVVPRLYASGRTLGDYDLSWLVIERFDHGPLGTRWHEDHTARVADAAARFHAAAAGHPTDQDPPPESWETLVREAQGSLRVNAVPQRQQWKAALKTLRQRLDGLLQEWAARPLGWVHGDLHLANAMSRAGHDAGPVSLIDLAEVRAGHWVEDAVYLERQLWLHPQRLAALPPVKAIAKARRRQGLAADDDYPRLAMIRRALLAGAAPYYLKAEGSPPYLEACLARLEQALAGL